MALFAIADLHFAFSVDKPMDICRREAFAGCIMKRRRIWM